MGVKLLTIAALSSLLLSYSCRSSLPLTDERLVAAFNSNRELFEKLAAFSASGELLSSDPPDPNIFIPEGSEPVFAELKRRTGFREAQMYVRKGPPRTLWIPVELRGTLSISSSVFGYVYSPSPMKPLVGTVWNEIEDHAVYKRIAEDWYLFINN
jgi:hypothetical protein